MGLVYCPDCGATVSDRAPACPTCGCPIAAAAPAAYQPPPPPTDPLDQLARAQPPLAIRYATPSPGRGRRRTQTVEQTGKGWKAQLLLSGLMLVTGGVMFVLSLADGGRGRDGVLLPVGLVVFLVGMIWYGIARVGAWWNHG